MEPPQQEETLPEGKEATIELTVDEVIDEYVGAFGFSQLIQVILVSLAWIFECQTTLVTIFSDAEPQAWRCIGNNTCHGRQFGKGSSVCDLDLGTWEWVGGNKSTTIAQWGLICEHKFLAAIPASCFFVGSIIGSVIYGRLADSILGRKKSLIFSCLLSSITTLLTSFAPNIYVYAFFRFLMGLTRSGIGVSCIVLATEAVGRKWRGQVGQYGFFFFTVGFLSLPPIAYYTRTSWRALYQLISIAPFVYSLLIIPFVEESPRWLLIRERKAEALKVLSTLARRNGRSVPTNITLLCQTTCDSSSNLSLWKCKWARIRILKAMVAGFCVGFMYYGMQLNVENLNFSKYLTVVINGLTEIPAVFLGSLMLSYMKRRMAFSLSSFLAGVSCFLCIIFAVKGNMGAWGNWVQLVIEAIGFMAASTAFDILYIYAVEMFPTNVRNFAVSLLRQALMLGAAVAPLLVVVGRFSSAISFLVFGGLAILSGVMSIWLPETRNAPLYETLEQQEKDEKLGACDEGGLELKGEQKNGDDVIRNC